MAVRQQIHIGPLPSAADLERYEATLPGLAARIIAMAEGHAANGWKNDRGGGCWRFKHSGLLLSWLCPWVAAGSWLVDAGHTLAGFGAVAAPAAAIVRALIQVTRP